MHIHVSALDALIVWAYMIIGLFLMRLATVRFSDSSLGKALSFIN